MNSEHRRIVLYLLCSFALTLLLDSITHADTMDYGDAPAPYPTLEADDGARHLVGPIYYLGDCVDAEADGQPSVLANGDDDNGYCPWPGDEDGVLVWWDWEGRYMPLSEDPVAHFQANGRYTLAVVASTNGYLNAWMDYNGDGDWSDPGEQIFIDSPLAPGTNALALHIPATASNAASYVRFRFGSQTGLSCTGLAEDGEVEDYDIELKEAIHILAITVDGEVTLTWNDTRQLYTVKESTNLLSATMACCSRTIAHRHEYMDTWFGCE